ncbi:MAG: hypothetical protein JKY54_04420 [Flavobacteriales bacterium]|nr:hypothetical protein [Flavobacteriales bacterium]
MDFFERSFWPIVIAFATFLVIFLIRKLINRKAGKDAVEIDELEEEDKSIDGRLD